jgi:DnaJ family protein C protein 9
MENIFRGDDKGLYRLLNVQPDSSSASIKKSFKNLALKIHPDKNKDDPEATKNFQALNEAYKILIDDDKRKIYDETGSIDDESIFNFESAYKYYREIFVKITFEDIDNYSKKYRYSQEEESDVLKYYLEYKGDVRNILEGIVLSVDDDKERFCQIIKKGIANKKIKYRRRWGLTQDKIKSLPDDHSFIEINEAEHKDSAQYKKRKLK